MSFLSVYQVDHYVRSTVHLKSLPEWFGCIQVCESAGVFSVDVFSQFSSEEPQHLTRPVVLKKCVSLQQMPLEYVDAWHLCRLRVQICLGPLILPLQQSYYSSIIFSESHATSSEKLYTSNASCVCVQDVSVTPLTPSKVGWTREKKLQPKMWYLLWNSISSFVFVHGSPHRIHCKMVDYFCEPPRSLIWGEKPLTFFFMLASWWTFSNLTGNANGFRRVFLRRTWCFRAVTGVSSLAANGNFWYVINMAPKEL